ncbi:MAG: galactose-1-phosphate uridylyltransferase [Bryobacteraceae bacterium]|nr:galactose-1-phosphate uridylyltransferase [Bryobacteraceae bacterium]
MSEFRTDPITGRTVIIAPERAGRPNEFQNRRAVSRTARICAFCPGNEKETPPEILSYRDAGRADEPGWRIRVVPNKYPALPAHEVIIETPDHNLTLADMPLPQAAEVLHCFQERLAALRRNERLQFATIFKNQGEGAGATIEHAHTQLLALPDVPWSIRQELEASRSDGEASGVCAYCRMARQAPESRRVLDSEGFTVISPYAARFPFETWIVPKDHGSHFDAVGGEGLADLAGVFQDTLRRINRALEGPAYNMVIQTAPLQAPPLAYYHWRIEIIPRLNKIGGFEWGTGVYINPTPPEEAARRLSGEEA